MSEEEKDNAGVVFPPPFIFIGCLLIGFVADFIQPASMMPDSVQYPAGGLLIVLGVALVVSSFRQFRKHGTNIRPDRPVTAIVSEGPFRFTRNPIYLSLALLYLGISIAADSPWGVGMVIPALLIINFLVIPREERYLERTFGEEYLRYKSSVRRWL